MWSVKTNSANKLRIVDELQKPIANMQEYGYMSKEGRKTQEENARLIAVAPALYDALHRLLHCKDAEEQEKAIQDGYKALYDAQGVGEGK